MKDKHDRTMGAKIDDAEKALQDAESRVGKESIELCPAIDSLAELYHIDGLYAKAELLYKRSLTIQQKNGDQEGILLSLHRLAVLYRIQHKLDEAEQLYLQALTIAQEMRGPNDLSIAERLNYLAGLYNAREDYAASEEALKRSVAIYDSLYGAHNYYSGLCEMALAILCHKAGRTAEARDYYEQSRELTSGDLGISDHSEARALSELAQTYFAQGRVEEAELLFRHSLVADESRLWPQHPLVAQALHIKAELFRAQAKYEQAEELYTRALLLREEIFGPFHPEVAQTAMGLASMFLAQGNYAAAEPILKKALKARVISFGVEHPGVAACVESYAALLKRTKRTAIATRLELRAKEIRSRLVTQSEKGASARAQ